VSETTGQMLKSVTKLVLQFLFLFPVATVSCGTI